MSLTKKEHFSKNHHSFNFSTLPSQENIFAKNKTNLTWEIEFFPVNFVTADDEMILIPTLADFTILHDVTLINQNLVFSV